MKTSGFEEVAHTADWAIHVWAADLPQLFAEAARGMYTLMHTRLQPAPRVRRRVELSGGDVETLLVAFLNELLYIGERDHLGFDQVEVSIEDGRLAAELEGAPLAGIEKPIKAVTYHLLAVRESEGRVETALVFDV